MGSEMCIRDRYCVSAYLIAPQNPSGAIDLGLGGVIGIGMDAMTDLIPARSLRRTWLEKDLMT